MGRPLADLPEPARPRERLAASGCRSLSDMELLALQLRSGTAGSSANDLATDLLAEFGSVQRLATATVEELTRVPGVGTAKASSIVAAFEIGRRAQVPAEQRPNLARASDVAELAAAILADSSRERVIIFICDRAGTLLHKHELSAGSDRRSVIEVREVLNAVLRHDGAAFALAHNHPSGDPSPSDADVRATEATADGAKTVGLRFLGHVIVAGREAWSAVPITPAQQRLG
ncbi:MAG: DNA repair protein RadC [Actinomycetota bacterium]